MTVRRSLGRCRISPWVLLVAALSAHAEDASVLHHRVHFEGKGGAATVIFESGLGDTLEVWQTIQPRVAAHCARTFSYNRAGYLDSEPGGTARNASHIIGELRDELRRQHVEPPYVLVGHSLGGLYMQYFARNFPNDVRALVLVDSTHRQQGLKIDATADTPYQARTAVTLYMPLVVRQELADSVEAGREVSDSPAAVATPTIVLSSTRSAADAILQNEIAADFPAAHHVFVEHSGHYIQRDQPDVVIAAIRRLAGCDPGRGRGDSLTRP